MRIDAMLEAHFTSGSKTRAAELAIAHTANGGRVWLARQAVAGRAEARKLAKEIGATPWNF